MERFGKQANVDRRPGQSAFAQERVDGTYDENIVLLPAWPLTAMLDSCETPRNGESAVILAMDHLDRSLGLDIVLALGLYRHLGQHCNLLSLGGPHVRDCDC